jgi:flavorubredoxin
LAAVLVATLQTAQQVVQVVAVQIRQPHTLVRLAHQAKALLVAITTHSHLTPAVVAAVLAQ